MVETTWCIIWGYWCCFIINLIFLNFLYFFFFLFPLQTSPLTNIFKHDHIFAVYHYIQKSEMQK